MQARSDRLVADIGGTNARFGLAGADGQIESQQTLSVADYPSFGQALESYLKAVSAAPKSAAIAAAGPRDGARFDLTNANWRIDAGEASAVLGGAPTAVFNDLEAVALALPHLGAGDLEVLHQGRAPADAPKLALNVGTGLGAAVAIRFGDGPWRALPTEAGHMRFAATDAAEASLAPHVSTYEDVLSGRGFALLTKLQPDAAERRRLFSQLLGRVAGDIAVATGAWGGLYLCGGVLDDWQGNVDVAVFRQALIEKGQMTARMAALPVARITRPAPAMLGLAHAAISGA